MDKAVLEIGLVDVMRHSIRCAMVVFGESAKTLANVDWIGIGSFASAFFVLRKLKWNPILTMCLCGVAGLGLHILLGI